MVYCSKECAPLGMYGALEKRYPTKSELTEKYTTKECGDRLAQYKKEEPQRTTNTTQKKLTQHILTKDEKETKRSMQQTQNNTKNNIETGTKDSVSFTKNTETKKELPSIEPQTQSEDSYKLSESLETASLQSVNLIDDSATQMHGLMRSLAEKTSQKIKDGSVVTSVDVQGIVRCASEMRNLLKLKLDIYKVITK